MLIQTFAGALVALSAAAAPADLTLPALFSDGMVLQRSADVAVWGWATPGAAVEVRGGWSLDVAHATAGTDGRWQASLRTPASAPATTLRVSSGGEEVVVEDVLLGEVWLCSGQSNMEWTVRKSIIAARRESGLAEDVLGLQRPNIRFFTVPRVIADGVAADLPGVRWAAASGDAALDCTAVGYFFAARIQDELDVPVGLLHASWGGTPAESWTPREAVAAFPRHAATLAALASDLDTNERAARFLAELGGVESVAATTWDEAVARADGWRELEGPQGFENAGLAGHDGAAWYRLRFEVPEAFAGQPLTLNLPPIDDLDLVLLGGRVIGATLAGDAWARPRRYELAGGTLPAGPVELGVLALDTGGLGGFGAGGPVRLATPSEARDVPCSFAIQAGPDLRALPSIPYEAHVGARTPSALYDSMIAPLVPYGVRGVLWYQGEANREHPAEYAELFPALIEAWRASFGAELPFYFAQIAPYDYGPSTQDDDDLGALRQAQAGACALPATGMAVTSDVGDPKDIHPLDKWSVGERLALHALAKVYGRTDIDPESPTATRAVPEGGELRVEFEHVGGGLVAPGALAHFQVSPDGRVFWPAEARIAEDGKAVLLRAAGVPEPRAARYLWSDDAEATLFGGTGLPAAPFVIE